MPLCLRGDRLVTQRQQCDFGQVTRKGGVEDRSRVSSLRGYRHLESLGRATFKFPPRFLLGAN